MKCRGMQKAECWYITISCSGLLGSPVGRSSVVVKHPTLEWTLSHWCSCWRTDRDSANPPTQHALKKCELIIQAISHYHLYAIFIQPSLTAPQLTFIGVQLMNGNLVSLMDCLFTYVRRHVHLICTILYN